MESSLRFKWVAENEHEKQRRTQSKINRKILCFWCPTFRSFAFYFLQQSGGCCLDGLARTDRHANRVIAKNLLRRLTQDVTPSARPVTNAELQCCGGREHTPSIYRIPGWWAGICFDSITLQYRHTVHDDRLIVWAPAMVTVVLSFLVCALCPLTVFARPQLSIDLYLFTNMHDSFTTSQRETSRTTQ